MIFILLLIVIKGLLIYFCSWFNFIFQKLFAQQYTEMHLLFKFRGPIVF